MPRSMSSGLLMQQRNALLQLARHLQQPSGGVLSSSLQVLCRTVRAAGGFAYRASDGQLSMVADHNVPRKAKPWIHKLAISEEDWFVAQHVARTRKPLIDRSIAGEMHSIGPAFEEGGWRVLAAAPVSAGRTVYGVIAIAGSSRTQFDDETLRFLSAVGAMLGLAMDRAELAGRARDERHEAVKRAELATLGLIGANAAQDMDLPLQRLDEALDRQATLIAVLRQYLEDAPDEVRRALDDLDTGLDHGLEELRVMNGINSRQLSLSRESSAERLNLVVVAHNAAQMASGTFSAQGVALALETEEGELWVDGRQESLVLVLVQLLVQAAETCEASARGAPEVLLRLMSDDNRHIVSIDTSGAPEGRPFQAITRRQGGSSGAIDINAIKQTVLAHKGHIEVDRSELGGIRISVVLPHSRSGGPMSSDSGELASLVPPPGAQQETIVIIDDNDALVRVVRRQLRDYQLRSASNVQDGVELLQRLNPPPRLVICDINLPDGTGIDIHQAVDFQLGSRFVFVTSGLLEREVSDYIQSISSPVFRKPLAVDEMRALLVEDDLANHPSIMATLSPDPTPPPFHLNDMDRRKIMRRMARTRREGRRTTDPNPKVPK